MSILSILSIIIYTSFFIGAIIMLTAERKSILNLSASGVLISLGWWSFCNSFFFAATTLEQAWFWHKLSSFGWCGFVILTTYYFIVLTDYNRHVFAWWKKALFFAPTIILLLENLLGKTTSLAQNIVMSTNGWGWTYENSITSFWLWAYLLYVIVYFSFAFYLLSLWSKSVKHKMKKEMAIKFIVLDVVTIFLGVITDVIMPLSVPILPALASVFTAIFGLGYFGIIYRYDLFNIDLVISADDILQTSSNSLFVIDENLEVLKCNRAVYSIFGYKKGELLGINFMKLLANKIDFGKLFVGKAINDLEVKMICKDKTVKTVLISASMAEDKHHNFLCIIISCQDISRQVKILDELEIERVKYKKLANDYQKLAYYDPLTGLPNRRHFFDELNDFEKQYQLEKKDFAVIFLDLDNFKHANDIYGHKGGDALLKGAAYKLSCCLDNNEFLSRLGGDEFTIIMPYSSIDDITRKLKRISGEFKKPFLFDGNSHEIGISAGYGVFSEINDLDRLVQKADDEMYDNKSHKAKLCRDMFST
ncbi:MAG: diguanylate cyclase [Anaerovoracaceae bacterium]